MIQFSALGVRGRLGNSLFQIASMHGIAKRLGTTCGFPRWKYERYFKNKLPRMHKGKKILNEPHFHFEDNWFEDEKDYDGWLQSEKYFEGREEVKKLFEFETGFYELVKSKYRRLLEKETICISVRRGDFVGNPNYELIPDKFYIGALLKFDYTKYNILFFSDDLSYCRTHFECLENATFIDTEPMEQLCLMTMCENHIISQSTFSWWGAYLSNSKRVIRPAYNFSPMYISRGNIDRDFWAKGWEVFDHKKVSFNLPVSFLIPVQYDHSDRKENLDVCVKSLTCFDCEILIGENKSSQFSYWSDFKKIEYVNFDFDKFHRTKILNELAKKAKHEIIVIYDSDVLLPPMALIEAVRKLKDVIYPYDGRFARVPRKWYSEIVKYLDCGILSRYTFEGTRAHELKSVGGAIMFRKDAYFAGGGENENFISYAPEDQELFERFTRLGFKVERINSILYHLDHYIGADSYIYHDKYQENLKELDRVRSLNEEQLKNEFLCHQMN